jgi:hypothetical protein
VVRTSRIAAYSRERNGPSPTPNRKGRARCGQPDGTIVLPAGREIKDVIVPPYGFLANNRAYTLIDRL